MHIEPEWRATIESIGHEQSQRLIERRGLPLAEDDDPSRKTTQAHDRTFENRSQATQRLANKMLGRSTQQAVEQRW